MTGQQSDMGFKPEKPAARAPHGSKRVRLSGKVSRARVDVRGLEVTQDDIDNAMKANSHHCMVADAIKRQIPGVTKVQVDLNTIRYNDNAKGRRVLCLTPLSCQKQLVKFDLGMKVNPFRFNILSTQVTPVMVSKPKLDEDGNPVKYLRTRKYRTKDGTDKVRESEEVRNEAVVAPSTRREFVSTGEWTGNGRHGEHTVGGRLPPGHRPSMRRTFGVKGFTWDEGEDPEVVSARHRIAWGDAYPGEDEAGDDAKG